MIPRFAIPLSVSRHQANLKQSMSTHQKQVLILSLKQSLPRRAYTTRHRFSVGSRCRPDHLLAIPMAGEAEDNQDTPP